MSREDRAGAPGSLRLGVLGAMGFAAWLGIPLLEADFAGRFEGNAAGWIEPVIAGLLVCFALFTTWRFALQRGLITGPVLLVALIIEVAKRITVHGPDAFGAADAITAALIFVGLLIGIRAARATRSGTLL